MSAPALEVRGLHVRYGQRAVLRGMDLAVPAGVVAGVIGPNGSGKTTLLKACLGLVPVQAGSVRIAGETLDAARRRVAYMPQRESVDWDFPITALDVVAMGAHVRVGWGWGRTREARKVALHWLERLGLADMARRPIGALSGGQQQRVFLARSLAQDAAVYLMDEPLASIDVASEQVVLAALRDLRAQGRTVILVHHDIDEARAEFDWAVLMNGQLIAEGPAATVLSPANLRVTYGGRMPAWARDAQPAVDGKAACAEPRH